MAFVPSRILVDANVLHSRTLRDWILLIESNGSGIFSTLWTEDIMVETLKSIRVRNPGITGREVHRLREKIVAAMSEQVIDYAAPADAPVADPLDRHVHGAAMAGQADMLVTCDRGFLDLSEEQTDELPYEILHPDQLLVQVDDSAAELVLSVTRWQWEYWRQKDPSTDLCQKLRNAQCPVFASRIENRLRDL